MTIIELIKRPGVAQNEKLANRYFQFETLLEELRKHEIPTDITHAINKEVEQINSFTVSDKALLKQVKESQSRILKLIEKELKLVPQKHYMKMWLAVGMAAFGLPFGVVFGVSLGNMGLIGIGIPIGMALGIAIGTAMDKKAFESGKQLDVEIKY